MGQGDRSMIDSWMLSKLTPQQLPGIYISCQQYKSLAKPQRSQRMNENEIAKIIVDTAFRIHTRLGPGLLESAYQAIMVYELQNRGLQVEAEISMPIHYDGITLDVGYRADIVVERLVIIELKSVEKIAEVHKKQLLTYLRLADMRLGLLVNFGAPLIKDGISRIVNGLKD